MSLNTKKEVKTANIFLLSNKFIKLQINNGCPLMVKNPGGQNGINEKTKDK